MSKKNFSSGLNSLLEPTTRIIENEDKLSDSSEKEKTAKKKGRPKTNFKEISKTSQEGTREGEVRATFIVKESILEKIKAVAYWDRKQIKSLIDDALGSFLEEKGEKYVKQALQAFEKKGK